MGRRCTGKKLMENMMTTAINIFATFLLVLNWLSNVLLAHCPPPPPPETLPLVALGEAPSKRLFMSWAESCLRERVKRTVADLIRDMGPLLLLLLALPLLK